MSWTATARYGLAPAPGGLAFVQDLLNTLSAGRPREPDLLQTADDARAWLDQALRSWSAATHRPAPTVELTAEDVRGLLGFREDLARSLHAQHEGDTAPEPAPVASLLTLPTALRLDEHGTVRAEPRGTGWRQAASLALIEILQAQCTDTLRRLKTCRNPRCLTAFYDRSRNNSGVWHDVHVCGNAANLRNYRARKRAGADQA
ncbi:CGNR zinc finger domain-containing protein [Streptomyces sp. NPDC059224]|uniref:CGNR zinc finger domain-containing protein n=1 Tax=Streptomyces sp. NPDC059224 TaxID=3346775 RepID=UPI0036A5263F